MWITELSITFSILEAACIEFQSNIVPFLAISPTFLCTDKSFVLEACFRLGY